MTLKWIHGQVIEGVVYPVGYVFGLFVARLCNWNGFRRLYKEVVSHSGYIREGDSLVGYRVRLFPSRLCSWPVYQSGYKSR